MPTVCHAIAADSTVGVATAGSVARIPLRRAVHHPTRPQAFIDDQPVRTHREMHDNEFWWFAYLGVPLAQRTPLGVRTADKVVHIDIKAGSYGESHISIDDKKYTEPLSAAARQRIRQEQQRIDKVRRAFTPTEHAPYPVILPVVAATSTPYGFRRYINGQLRSRHRGLDLAAATGTPVRAPLAGTIGVAGDLFYTGNTVIIDHGFGMNSLLAHMSTIGVQVGDSVQAGDVVGKTGNTGRSTGPHLHWGLALNGQLIDPAFFLSPAQLDAIQYEARRRR